MPDRFAITKDSIQIPYSRFIADSAAGLMAMLAAVTAYYFPIVSSPPIGVLMSKPNASIGSGIMVFVLVVSFLLATPLGFILNAVSWLTLSQLLSTIETTCFSSALRGSRIFPVLYVSASRYARPIAEELRIQEHDFAQSAWFLREVLEIRGIVAFNRESYVRGLVILLRNGALLALLACVVTLYFATSSGWARTLLLLGVTGVMVALILRGGTSTGMRIARCLCGAIGIVIMLALPLAANSATLAGRAELFLALSALWTCVAGLIGYYNCCAALLNTHLAAAALGCQTVAASPGWHDTLFGIATALVARAATFPAVEKADD